LACVRKITIYNKIARNKIWNVDDIYEYGQIHRLQDRVYGLVSFGNIAKRVAELMKVFGMKVMAFDPFLDKDVFKEYGVQEAESLEELFASCNIISLHTPLTPKTEGMIDINLFKRMPRGSILINTSRGGIIKEDDLYSALKEGVLDSAGVDVIIDEAEFESSLYELDNVIITPHVAYYSEEALIECRRKAAEQIGDAIGRGITPQYLVNKAVIIDNAFADAKAGHTKYTDFRGDPELRQEIINYYREEYAIDVKDEEVFVCASACLGMYLALEAIVDDGEEVILQAPYFTPYPQQVVLARGIPVELPTYEEEDFQINIERLEGLITERTKALVINSPSNPTGNCLTVEVMEKIAQIAVKYDLIVIADDIYTSFSYQNAFVPFASLPSMKERTIILNSFSKNFTMTGWRIGNIIAPDYIIKTMQQINENVVFTAPSISQRAAIYALKNRHEIQPPMIEEYRKRMFYAAERINRIPKLSVIYPPKGSFYLFMNIKRTGLSSAEAADLILREAHVVMLPGDAFGACGEGYIRIACTVNVEKMKEAFDRIEKISLFN